MSIFTILHRVNSNAVIYEAYCFDVAQGRMIGAPNGNVNACS